MGKRTRSSLLLAILLCLVPIAFIANRDTTPTQADLLRKAAREDRAFLETQMPHVVVPGFGTRPNARHKKEYTFRQDWFSESIPVWEQVLAEFKGKPGLHYLEIGVYEGRSFFWTLDNVLTHPTSRLTGVDPFIESPGTEGFEAIFLRNLQPVRSAGAGEYLEGLLTGRTQEAPARRVRHHLHRRLP